MFGKTEPIAPILKNEIDTCLLSRCRDDHSDVSFNVIGQLVTKI